MNLIRWTPFHELLSLSRSVGRPWDYGFIQPQWLFSEFDRSLAPAVDMYETDNELVVKAVVPGVEADGLDVSINGNTLTIKGETNTEQERKHENYVYQECRYGTFTRSLALPDGLKSDKAEASMENGMLTLTIPKAESVKPKAIKVKTKSIAEGKSKKEKKTES